MSSIKTFTFEGGDDAVKKVDKVVDVNTHLVQYFDHEGKQQTRMIAREPRSGTVYIVNGQIQGQAVLVPATGWFQDQVKEHLAVSTAAPESI